ncbi:MAG: DUF4347 domain-containing protein [Scytonematopsis contorta HA4267-MV1]|jgi:hypothetical protein|nr:DUF4347 domain-containing protein [Scytonematopsis contorta HA4267-MV1]
MSNRTPNSDSQNTSSEELALLSIHEVNSVTFTQGETEKIIVFIDAGITNYQSLIAGIKPEAEVVILNPEEDGIEQVTKYLRKNKYSSVHIVSHGSDGSLQLGGTWLSEENLDAYASSLQEWGSGLTEGGDILLYSCDVAQDEKGKAFVQRLSSLIGADIAASDDLTGSAQLGGDWVLEFATGMIQTPLAFQTRVMEAYSQVLASAGDVIINEFSQGSSGAKEWVEILVVTDNLNLQNHKLVDGNSSLDITLSGSGFSSLKAGTLIVLYNGGDRDGAITPDLNYDPANGDYTLQISSLNSTGDFAVTRNAGWNNTTEAFTNANATDIPRLLNASGVEIYRFPRTPTPGGIRIFPNQPRTGQATAYTSNTSAGATVTTNWSVDFPAAGGNPGLPNGGSNTTWINSLRGNRAPVLDAGGDPTLPTIDEDIPNASNSGIFVADLIKDLITDTNNNNQGIAVTGLTGNGTNGTWQYSLDGGNSWRAFGAVSETSATVLSALTPMYRGTLGGTPDTQGWFQFGSSPAIPPVLNAPGGTQSFISNQTRLVTDRSGVAGYSNYNGGLPIALNPAFPVLDSSQGFTLSFELKINSEVHSSDDNSDGLEDRAGFALIVITNDNTKAIELGFWEDRIWAQNGGSEVRPVPNRGRTLFTQAEGINYNTKVALTRYDLRVKDDTYQLFAAGGTTPILTGSLRNYTAFNHTDVGPGGSSLPYNIYQQPNLLFLGDSTSSAQADFNLGRVELHQNTKVRFVPNPDFNGTADISFRAWDRTNALTSGTAGVNLFPRGVTAPYSGSISETATVTINPVNDAPSFTNNTTLVAINEDITNPIGDVISNIFTGLFIDKDAGGILNGVAVVGNTANSTTEGTWQYSTDGNNWFNIGAVDDAANALALSENTNIRFVPVANYNGVPPILTVRALDNTYSSFTNGGSRVNINTATRGGITVIAENSNTITTIVNAVNDAPSFTNNATLAAIRANTANPTGNLISSLFTSLFSDPDTGASLSGVAVVGNTANSTTEGAWQYSTDGTNWFAIGTVGDGTNALALSDATKVRFVPVANYNGTPPTLSVRALDNTYSSFTSGSSRVNINTTTRGGITAIAANPNTISTNITGVNNAPSFTNNAALAAVAEDTANPAGNIISSLFTGLFSDSDTGASLSGVAVVGNTANSTTEGAWQYSTDGTNWFDIGSVTDGANALALSATTKVRFVPVSNYNGTPAALSVRALDNTYSSFSNGSTKVTLDTTTRGGVTAIAANPNTITTSITAVNDAPSFTNNAALAAVPEDTTNPAGNIISNLFTGLFTDPDTGASLSGIAVIGNTANQTTEGAWQYSTGGTDWFDIGSVTDGDALALSAATKVRFVPVSNYNGTPAALSVRALDNTYSSFSNGSDKVTINTTTRGGVTAIAANPNTITTNITAVNDAPSFTNNATLVAIPGNTANPPGNSISNLFTSLFSDPDTGASLNGVAVVGNSANATTEGAWQYSTDGNNWFDIGVVGDGANALALSAATKVRFVPVANYNGTPPTLSVRALDNNYSGFTIGDSRTNINTTTRGGITAIADNLNTITTNIIIPVNQNPIVTLLPGTSPNVLYTENDAPVIITSGTVRDDDSSNFDTGTLTIRFLSGGSADDRLNIRNQGTEANQINLDGRIIKYGSTQIGTFSGGIGTENLVISLNANATSIAVQALLGNITYANVSQNPSITNRTVEIVLTDGDGGTSIPVSKNIALTPQNDAPFVGEAVILYDGTTKLSPTNPQAAPGAPWFTYLNTAFLTGGEASEVAGSSSGITLTTDNKAYAGYIYYGIDFGTALLGGGKLQLTSTPLNFSFPKLDRNLGYTLSFQAELKSETNRLPGTDVNQDGKDDRAGFNVTLLSDDKKGIQLGFWGDRIWAYEDSTTQINPSDEPDNPLPRSNFRTLFTQAEGVSFNTKQLQNYNLTVFGDTYTLFANDNVILSGRLRDYSAFKPLNYPIDIPELPNIPGLELPNIPGLEDILKIIDISQLPNILEILNNPLVQSIIETLNVPDIPNISDFLNTTGFSNLLQLIDISEIPDVLTILNTPQFLDIIKTINSPEIQDVLEFLGTPELKKILEVLGSIKLEDIIQIPSAEITPPNPYEKGNLIFFGDNSVQAGATVNLSGISLTASKNIPIQLINEDQSTNPIRFTIQDFETAADNLIINPTSDNTSLIPNANIVVEGTGQVRIVTVTPTANENGNAKISLNVSDGTNTTTYTFDIRVFYINDAPSFTKGTNQTITAGAGQQTITGWVSGFNPGANELEQVVSSYTVNVTNNAGIFATAPTIDPTTGNLIYTPVDTINSSTTATVEVLVKDDGGTDFGGIDTSTTPQIFTVTVNPQVTSIEATDATAAEPGNDTGTFRISREFTKGNLTVNFAVDNNSTASNSDYALSGGVLNSAFSVVIPDGQSFVDFNLIPVDDNFAEARETLQLNLVTGSGYTINPIKNNGTVSIINDDVAGIGISFTTGLITTEAGGTASFNVKLKSQPTADVTFNLNSDNTSEGIISKNSLTFNSINWNTEQIVTITGVDDTLVDGDIAYKIVTSAAVSQDLNYNGINPDDISVTNINNDIISIEFNIINGTNLSETFDGTAGNDRIFAFGGNDTVVAGLGIDEIFGGDGNDRLFGGDADDRIFGEIGNDQMWGDAGEDFIYGGAGNDVCTGGFGRDTFVVTRNEGVDTITDFRLGEDSIACGSGLRFDSLLISQSGNNTLLIDSSNNRSLAILIGVNASTLTANSFRTI